MGKSRRWLWLLLIGSAIPSTIARAQEPLAPPPAGISWGNVFRGREPQAISYTMHPAVARVVVQEKDGIAFGSGTLVDVEEERGLLITNWHVVRDATGSIEVTFPDGFRSQAKVLKTDRDWDLAALVIWKPNVAPVKLSPGAAQPGEPLTIAGYGSGQFRAVTSRCTQYVSPGVKMPYEMVEVAAEARQGDSGGPILNQRGEMAGVLFGAGGGTTSGSYVGRVRWFLASISPRLGDPNATVDYSNVASSNPFVRPGGIPASTVSIADNKQPDDNWRVASRTTKPDANAAPEHDNELTPVNLPSATTTAAPRASQVTFGSLPESQLVGPPVHTAGELVTSEPTLPLFPRPLPVPQEAPGELRRGGNTPTITAEATTTPRGDNELWSWFFGQTPIEQGKSMLAVLGIAAVLSRFWRSSSG